MSTNTRKQPHIEHAPAARAQGLDEEVTAQPRSIADEVALEASAEDDLSVDPEDLGARFLSDAVEQGDFNPDQAWSEDSSLAEGPARDQALGGPNFVAGNSVWEQTVDLETRTQGRADQLREASALTEQDELDALMNERLGEGDDTRMRAADLFDREGDEGDETIEPELDAETLDEQGSHTRLASDVEDEPKLGAAPRNSTMRPKAQLAAAARTVLDRSASLLRRVADRLHHYGT